MSPLARADLNRAVFGTRLRAPRVPARPNTPAPTAAAARALTDRQDREQRDRDRSLLSRLGLHDYAVPQAGMSHHKDRVFTLRARPVFVALRPWGLLGATGALWWFVLDRHGTRVRFSAATLHVAGTIAQALAAQGRDESARWSG